MIYLLADGRTLKTREEPTEIPREEFEERLAHFERTGHELPFDWPFAHPGDER